MGLHPGVTQGSFVAVRALFWRCTLGSCLAQCVPLWGHPRGFLCVSFSYIFKGCFWWVNMGAAAILQPSSPLCCTTFHVCVSGKFEASQKSLTGTAAAQVFHKDRLDCTFVGAFPMHAHNCLSDHVFLSLRLDT